MMRKQYTEQQINLFFARFKQLPEYFEIEKVHQLINNPNAKAKYKVNFKYKPFKFIIMTSFFLVGISSFLFWLNPNFETEKKMEKVLQTNQFSANTNQIDNTAKETKTVEIQTDQLIDLSLGVHFIVKSTIIESFLFDKKIFNLIYCFITITYKAYSKIR